MKEDDRGSWIWNNGVAVGYENWASSGKVGYNLCHCCIMHINIVQ